MQKIQESDVAVKRIQGRRHHIALAQIDGRIIDARHFLPAAHFLSSKIEAEDLVLQSTFMQVKREQPHATTDIEQRRVRFAQELKSGRENRI